MPRFDFRCGQCGHKDEDVVVPVSLPELPLCPNCEIAMEKLPAAPSFRINGYNAKNGYSKGGKK